MEKFSKDVVLLMKNNKLSPVTIQKKEQYKWIDSIYKTMDAKNLKTLERIAKGNFLYSVFVPKAIRFKGDLSKAEMRYNYAIEVLKPYCENRYK